jgi:DNA-binding response OmpR family regulator
VSGLHILVVDDEPLVIEVLAATLESKYRVSSAHTVADAIAFLRTSHVDLVLVDSNLPDGRGTDVAAFAGECGATVVEMSGDPPERTGDDRIARAQLCKPFRMQTVLSTVEDALRRRR